MSAHLAGRSKKGAPSGALHATVSAARRLADVDGRAVFRDVVTDDAQDGRSVRVGLDVPGDVWDVSSRGPGGLAATAKAGSAMSAPPGEPAVAAVSALSALRSTLHSLSPGDHRLFSSMVCSVRPGRTDAVSGLVRGGRHHPCVPDVRHGITPAPRIRSPRRPPPTLVGVATRVWSARPGPRVRTSGFLRAPRTPHSMAATCWARGRLAVVRDWAHSPTAAMASHPRCAEEQCFSGSSGGADAPERAWS